MAVIDTGLGWSANENWLANSATAIGSVTSTKEREHYVLSYAGPINVATMSNLDRILTVSNNQAPVYFGVQYYVPSIRVCCLSTAPFTANLTGWGDAQGQQNFLGSGPYYATSQGLQGGAGAFHYPYPDHVLPGDTAEEAVANMVAGMGGITQTDFAKAGAGYSVICMCKWRTEYDGPVYVSPVLISSEPNNTLFTRNSAAPSANNTEHQYQGKTFYMRKAPLDTVTEGAELASTFPIVDLSGVAQTNDTIFAAIAYQSDLTVGEPDPYSGAGESEPGAEEATFDFDSTAIDFGSPPTITAAGMVELYIPSTTDLASLAQYLWAGSFDPDNFKKLFADPMDAIIGLQIVPVTATEIGTTPDTLYVGNISTGLSMPKASRQYVPVDCGSLTIPRRLGSYLDYSPHTEMQLYLPYIGFVDISPDDCMGGTVSVKYMVDIIGGTCVAQVKCNNHVLYEYAAACSCQVPVSAGQYQNIVLGAVRGGIGLVSGILGAAGGGLFSGLSEAADAAMSMTKPKIQRSGGFGGSSGLMGHQTPYIIYTVPRLIVPGRQNNFIGYPSYITRTLGDLTGFTQIDSIHLSGIPASQSEQAEIEQLLQEGVYL